MNERVKELQCLYDIAYIVEGPGITLDELCQGVVNLLPVSWQYLEIACARVTLGHKEFMSDNFKTTEWKQLANINVKGQKEGTVEVYYLEARPELDEGAFLKNERLLIDVIAERLGRITERKQVEEALKESEEKFRTFMETASDLMHMADKDGNITYVNESMTRTLGYSKEEMIGKHITQFLSKEVFEKDFKPKWEELITKGEIALESTVTKDGKEIYGEQKVVAIYDSDGKYAGSRAIFRDLTERMRMERELQEKNEQLDAQNEELQSQTEELMTQQQEIIEKTGEVERANRLKSEFLANMSHELRTPLNVIIGFSELMVDKVPGKINEEQRQCLSDILDSSHRLLNLVNEVLDLSKVESGKMEFKLENVALTEVIESLTRTMLPVLAPRKQSLDIEIEEGLPAVHVDEGRLEQVLLNLATNSSKFTPDGGKLKVEAVREDNWCQVSVIDNGIGIKEEDQERIFEPFCWLDNPLTKEKSGTGLGLALVETIVEKYGGRIWVESEYGKGSRFTFTLPLATNG
ncbi:Sensor histidine kinase RcsC [subsurface metagenome]